MEEGKGGSTDYKREVHGSLWTPPGYVLFEEPEKPRGNLLYVPGEHHWTTSQQRLATSGIPEVACSETYICTRAIIRRMRTRWLDDFLDSRNFDFRTQLILTNSHRALGRLSTTCLHGIGCRFTFSIPSGHALAGRNRKILHIHASWNFHAR